MKWNEWHEMKWKHLKIIHLIDFGWSDMTWNEKINGWMSVWVNGVVTWWLQWNINMWISYVCVLDLNSILKLKKNWSDGSRLFCWHASHPLTCMSCEVLLLFLSLFVFVHCLLCCWQDKNKKTSRLSLSRLAWHFIYFHCFDGLHRRLLSFSFGIRSLFLQMWDLLLVNWMFFFKPHSSSGEFRAPHRGRMGVQRPILVSPARLSGFKRPMSVQPLWSRRGWA